MSITPLLVALAAAAPAPTSTPAGAATVLVVRHAEKGEGGTDPDLSEAGRRRAEALVDALAPFELGAVIVTDTKRSAQTAAPVAAARGLTPVVVPTAGGAAVHVKAVIDAVRAAPAGRAVLVVGHSNTIPLILAALGGPEIRALCEKEYAPLFVLEPAAAGAAASLARKSYGAADPPGAAECK
jgi:phosphohistidine phosphatase SixA